MNRIVDSILAEFSKDNGIEALKESDRFEYLTSYWRYAVISAGRLTLRRWSLGMAATREWMRLQLWSTER